MNSKRIFVPIGALLVVILIIAGGFLIVNQSKSPESNPSKTGNYTELSEAEAHPPEIKVKSDELTRNAQAPFKVGKRYVYKKIHQAAGQIMDCYEKGGGHSTSTTIGGSFEPSEILPGCVVNYISETIVSEVEFSVEKIERAERTDCYVLSCKGKTISEDGNMTEMTEMEKRAEQAKVMFYYDKDAGKIIQITTEFGSVKETSTKDTAEYVMSMNPGGLSLNGCGVMFAQWMLALNKDFRWKQNIEWKQNMESKFEGNKNMPDMMIENTVIEYKVVGIENVDGRECFKVEIEVMPEKTPEDTESHARSLFKIVMWVDTKERIIVKQQTKMGNMMSEETNLVSEI